MPPDASASPAVRDAIDPRRFAWIRPLLGAYTSDFQTLAPLFAGNPSEPAAWRDAIARAQRAPRDRERLSALLRQQQIARQAPDAARRAASDLANPASVAIVTGQQAGLFGGPLYTLLKAITTIQLARRVHAEHGIPAVAVFWVETEDHDFDEVRTATVLDADSSVRAIALDPVPGAGTQPIASLVLEAGVATALASLEAALTDTDFTADLLTGLRARYRPGAGLGTAFAGWLEDLLGRHGLVVFDAADAGAKPLVADVFTRELANPGRTLTLVREAAASMSALGHEPQVEPAEHAVALLYLDEQGRHPIRYKDDRFAIEGQTRPTDDLRREAAEHPERFSPNVMLRPLVQDRLFPTAGYVTGPAELAYQAQLGGLYREFGIERPLLYPRASATLLDSAAARFLDRSRVPFEDLHAQDESALNRLLQSQLPSGIEQSLTDIDHELADRTRRLKESVTAVDPTLAGAVDTTLDRMRDTLKTLQNKIIQASKRKDDTLRRQFTRARALAFPGGHPQERVLSTAFFVNRYGLALADRLLDVLPLDTDKHYVLTL